MSMGGVVLRGIPPGGITVSHPIQTGKTGEPPTDPNGTKAATINNHSIIPILHSSGKQGKIGATRKTGGSNWGYKPPLLTRASRRGFSLCSSLSVIATLAAPKGAYLTNGSSYSFTLSLSTAISCFSWSLIYFLIVSSLRPTVLT